MAKPKNNHVKPTPEELEAQTQAAIEEAEKLKDAPVEEEESPEAPPEEEPEALEDEDETLEETEEDQADPSEEAKERLKTKLSASARENQKIYAKNRVMNKALTDADEIPEPTEEELASEFTDWDVMDDVAKKLAKEAVISRNFRKVISTAKAQATKIEKWNESVDEFIDDPKNLIDHPELEGKTDAFREYATVEANNSVPMNLLISAFLHDSSTGREPNKGKMFERGKGGPKQKLQPKSDKISLDEARKLRMTDFGKYKTLLKAGKIDDTI